MAIEQRRQIYRSMQGKEVDMAKLALQNEMVVAVGNVKVNARGDELGPGGKIIRKREDLLQADNPTPAPKTKKNVENEDPTGGV